MWSFRDSITTPRGTLASLISPRQGFQLSKVVFEERCEGEDEKSSRQQVLLESAQYTEAMHLKISSESLLGFTMLSTIWEAPRRSPRVVWLLLLETHLVFSCKKNAQNIRSLVRFILKVWLDDGVAYSCRQSFQAGLETPRARRATIRHRRGLIMVAQHTGDVWLLWFGTEVIRQ